MANKLSIDWPEAYCDALQDVTELEKFSGHVAVYKIARPGDVFLAGSAHSPYALREDGDYGELKKKSDNRGSRGSSNRGELWEYRPNLGSAGFEVVVPEGNIACIVLYDTMVTLRELRMAVQEKALGAEQEDQEERRQRLTHLLVEAAVEVPLPRLAETA